jgi:hypothetical protein
MPLVSGNRQITISKLPTGVAIGAYRIYPLDPNLINGATYRVWGDTMQLIPLCRLWRSQEHSQTGYIWGNGGEGDFNLNYHVQPTYQYVGPGWEDWTSRSNETMRRLLLGLPLPSSPTYDRAVYNLLNGQVGSNADAPGIATASPNGSTALANGQRVIFSNQRVVQRYYCLPIITDSSGGLAQASVPFQSNSPSGSIFSQLADDHKVYSSTGRDVTGGGTLTGMGGTGALTWKANSTAVVAPGDRVYVVPGIVYPEGSGFPLGGVAEAIYLNASAINAANVRDAANDTDLAAYAAPANGEPYFAVVGRERAALHYIYKRITVSSSSLGIVTIPTDERGVIAFISGTGAPTGRQDLPVITGLANTSSYSLLIYYPPKAEESWQFQFRVPRYKGLGSSSNGGKITSVHSVGHTQGGGNGTFLADGALQYEAIALHLPRNTTPAAVDCYFANYRMNFANEGNIDESSVRWISLSPAPGLSLPAPGVEITVDAGNDAQSISQSRVLKDGSGRLLGCLKKPIQCQQVWQLVVGLGLVMANGDRRLLLITTCEGDRTQSSPVQFSSDAPGYAGIDMFRLW